MAHITSVKEVVEAAPAEAGVEAAAAAPAEPEVIKKGKQETEEGAARRAKSGRRQESRRQEIGVKLVVGLGNPGIEYQFTPHNLGFLTIDRIAQRCKIDVSQPKMPGGYARR